MKVYKFGTTYVTSNDVFVGMCVICIFLLGAIAYQTGKRMDAELRVGRQAQMLEIANDKLVNGEVTK
jgi:hypothetical protein